MTLPRPLHATLALLLSTSLALTPFPAAALEGDDAVVDVTQEEASLDGEAEAVVTEDGVEVADMADSEGSGEQDTDAVQDQTPETSSPVESAVEEDDYQAESVPASDAVAEQQVEESEDVQQVVAEGATTAPAEEQPAPTQTSTTGTSVAGAGTGAVAGGGSAAAQPKATTTTKTTTTTTKTTSKTTATKAAPAKAAATSYLGKELTPADGIYELVCAANTKLVMGVTGTSASNSARLQLQTANTTIAQRFRLTRNADKGTYSIVNVNSEKALDVRSGQKTNGGIVQQYTNTGATAEQWRIYSAGGSNVYLVSVLKQANGKPLVLDVMAGKAIAGTYLQSYTCNGTKAQQWTLRQVKQTVKNGTYELRTTINTKFAIDVANGGRTAGTNVQIWKRNSTPSQWWRVKYDKATGYYTITSCQSGKVLDVRGGADAKGANVQMGNAADTASQRWTIKKVTDGYTVVSATGGKVLDVSGGKAAKGSNVQLWTSNGSAAQTWTFTKLNLPQIKRGTYRFASMADTSLCMDVTNSSTANKANVHLWTLGQASSQVWYVGDADSAGWRQISAGHCGARLSALSNDNVCLSTAEKVTAAQLWKIEPTETGYKLVNKKYDKVVDITQGKVAKGTNLQLWRNNNTNAQRFFLMKTNIVVGASTPIMGTSQATKAQMVSYYKSLGLKLPAKWRKDGVTIEKLVTYFWEEAAAEGVRADVAFAQSLHETGNFQFGNLVQPAQYNFAGLGATGPGHPGYTYKNARLGIRAQVQHLKAYASTEPLNKTCIDQRFELVNRGCAPTLGQLDGRWAVPGNGYGKMIADIVNAFLAQ